MKRLIPILSLPALGALATSSLLAQSSSSSASYTLLHAPAGAVAGGGQVTGGGGAIVAQTSVGNAIGGGVSDLTPAAVQLKHNYLGQLYDVTSVELGAAPTTIEEGGTRLLTTTVGLDDATFLALQPGDFTWGYDPGIASINASTGVATADIVYEDTATAVSAEYAGVTSPNLPLLVLNVDPDNYFGYGSDGLDDAWQVGFFGAPPNPNAAPGVDFDNDGDDNEKEFFLGFSPIDGLDFFRLTIRVADDPSKVDVTINRVIPDRTYSLRAGTNLLTYPTTAAPSFSVPTTETDKLIEDVPAPAGASFLQLEVTRP